MNDEPLFRAWRIDKIVAAPTFPEAGFRPAVESFDDFDYSWTPYAILGGGKAIGWPIATVAYHGRSRTWCCGCPAGVRGAAPCAHVAGVVWWVEVDRLRRGYLDLSHEELLADWAMAVARVQAIRSGWEPEPPNWRIAPAALFDALRQRGLVEAGPGADPIWELVAQAELIAA